MLALGRTLSFGVSDSHACEFRGSPRCYPSFAIPFTLVEGADNFDNLPLLTTLYTCPHLIHCPAPIIQSSCGVIDGVNTFFLLFAVSKHYGDLLTFFGLPNCGVCLYSGALFSGSACLGRRRSARSSSFWRHSPRGQFAMVVQANHFPNIFLTFANCEFLGLHHGSEVQFVVFCRIFCRVNQRSGSHSAKITEVCIRKEFWSFERVLLVWLLVFHFSPSGTRPCGTLAERC